VLRILLLLFVCQIGLAAPYVVKDLRPDWRAHTTNGYEPLSSTSDKLDAVYFEIEASRFPGHHLSVEDSAPFSLFVNGKLIYAGKSHIFDLDSLSKRYSPHLWIGIYTPGGLAQMSTTIVYADNLPAPSQVTALARKPTFFRNFVVIAVSVLLIFWLTLLRTNPQLTLDYFSFAKIFSVQERNENLLASRITSSVNFLFYLFCALLTGFLLCAVFYFAGSFFQVSRFMEITSLGDAFSFWLRLSFYILLLLTAKLIVVLIFSSLFNFRETVSFQFFNFLRFTLFTAVSMALLSLVYFVLQGGQPFFYRQLIVLALALMSAGSVMVFIKLLARAPFSFFHLFSYLCISEIIPLVIIIKIFF
jgi:hypothetical protein